MIKEFKDFIAIGDEIFEFFDHLHVPTLKERTTVRAVPALS